jgi:hypothetical protein
VRIAPIAEQLKGCGLVHIGGALEWAGLKTAPTRLPAGYIVPMSDSASDNRNDHGIDQKVTDEFAVILVLAAAARVQDGIDDQLHDLIVAVRDQRLVGWTHPDASGPTLYAGGRMLSADGASFAWSLQFRSGYHLRTRR